jgi:hypothetical protein
LLVLIAARAYLGRIRRTARQLRRTVDDDPGRRADHLAGQLRNEPDAADSPDHAARPEAAEMCVVVAHRAQVPNFKVGIGFGHAKHRSQWPATGSAKLPTSTNSPHIAQQLPLRLPTTSASSVTRWATFVWPCTSSMPGGRRCVGSSIGRGRCSPRHSSRPHRPALRWLTIPTTLLMSTAGCPVRPRFLGEVTSRGRTGIQHHDS